MKSRITQEITDKVKELINKHTPTHAVKLYMRDQTGLRKTQVNKHYKDIVESMDFVEPKEDGMVIKEIGENTLEVSEMQAGLKTLDDLLDRCAIDKKEWNVRFFKPNSWPVLSKDGPIVFSQVKAVLERIIPRQTAKRIQDLKDDLKSFAPVVKKISSPSPDAERILEVSVFDLHLGKFAAKDEVGENYNVEIAKSCFLESIQDIINKTLKTGEFERIVFPIGNDFLNIDTHLKTTTAGTPQDCDGNFTSIYREGRRLLIQAIDMLKGYAPVDVITCVGNHDTNSMFHIADALECYYHNDENVTVDNTPKLRKYYQYGKNMILFTHGDKEKQDTLPLLAATEEPAMWAATEFREVHCGHLHQEKLKEIQGFKIRIVPSLSGGDLWHYGKGYVGNKRLAQGFVFSKIDGLEAVIYSKAIK